MGCPVPVPRPTRAGQALPTAGLKTEKEPGYTRTMPQRVLLHVGTHKTGSTSLQHFFRDQNYTLLAAVGASYPDGFLIPTMHSELPLLTIRPERLWPARIRFPETQGETWLAAAAQHVRTTVHSSPLDILVWSHEDLSYLRFDDEFQRL